MPANRKASVHVSTITRAGARVANHGPRFRRRTTRLLEDRPRAVAHTHLTLPTAQVNADVVHGRSPLVPVSEDLERGQPLHPF